MNSKKKTSSQPNPKRAKVTRGDAGGGAASSASGGGAAQSKSSEQERVLARNAKVQENIKMDRLKCLEQNKTVLDMATQREAFGPLGVMCKPTVWSSKWDAGKLMYDFVRDSVQYSGNFPGHMTVFQRVVDAQKALRQDYPVEEQWTLWEVCLALEDNGSNDMELWVQSMEELQDMVGGWDDDLYDVEISPLFLYLQSEYEDDSDKEDDTIVMEPGHWHESDPTQCAIWHNMYVKHVLTGLGEKADEKAIREWTLRLGVIQDFSVNLHNVCSDSHSSCLYRL